MAISFNSIPSDTRVPLFYAEMDNSAANTARDSGASLLIGHASNDASIAVNSLVLVYVLSNAWLHGEANHNPEEGTVDLEFHGEEGFYQ